MQARTIALSILSLVSVASIACGNGVSDDAVASSESALRPRDPTDPGDPPPKPPAQPHSCPSKRIDMLRNMGSADCAMPPPSSYGTWSMAPLFPSAPAQIRNRLCTYTWQPNDTTGLCASPPAGTIPHGGIDRMGIRNCWPGEAGCGTSVYWTYDRWANIGGLPVNGGVFIGGSTGEAAKTNTDATSPFAAAFATQTVALVATNPNPTNPTGGPTTPFPGGTVVPSGGIGCCDACAEIADDFAYVVFPENTDWSSFYFDVTYQNPDGTTGGETINVDNPSTNVVQVNLNPARTYEQGMIWSLHTRL